MIFTVPLKMRVEFLIAAIGVLAQGEGVSSSSRRSPDLPHIVFILADDYGHAFAPGNRQDVHMPTLNSLAATGLTINEFYTYQFCSPSRAAFLTGRYPYKQTSTRTNYIPASVRVNRCCSALQTASTNAFLRFSARCTVLLTKTGPRWN
jgi:hypothetical protein